MHSQIIFDPTLLDQEITISIEPNGYLYQLVLRLKYYEVTDRWYMSAYDLETGEAYFLYVPLIANGAITGYGYDLAENMSYKRIGSFWVVPIENKPSTEHPSKDNLDQFVLVWSDNYD